MSKLASSHFCQDIFRGVFLLYFSSPDLSIGHQAVKQNIPHVCGCYVTVIAVRKGTVIVPTKTSEVVDEPVLKERRCGQQWSIRQHTVEGIGKWEHGPRVTDCFPPPGISR